jgi:L-amino acid N-acyltransferase YncA
MLARSARVEDAPAITAIYNQGIEDRMATFETQHRTTVEVAALLVDRLPTYSAVVVESGSRLVGFAWTAPYSSRQCYAGIGEFSVYVDRDARGMGVGRVALVRLIAECERRGFWKLTSRVFPDNRASLRLCRALGFREVGIHERHARLDGVWKDVVVVERLLGAAAGPGPADMSGD